MAATDGGRAPAASSIPFQAHGSRDASGNPEPTVDNYPGGGGASFNGRCVRHPVQARARRSHRRAAPRATGPEPAGTVFTVTAPYQGKTYSSSVLALYAQRGHSPGHPGARAIRRELSRLDHGDRHRQASRLRPPRVHESERGSLPTEWQTLPYLQKRAQASDPLAVVKRHLRWPRRSFGALHEEAAGSWNRSSGIGPSNVISTVVILWNGSPSRRAMASSSTRAPHRPEGCSGQRRCRRSGRPRCWRLRCRGPRTTRGPRRAHRRTRHGSRLGVPRRRDRKRARHAGSPPVQPAPPACCRTIRTSRSMPHGASLLRSRHATRHPRVRRDARCD